MIATRVWPLSLRSVTTRDAAESVMLPHPALVGEFSIEAVIAERRSVREYTGDPVTRAELGQLLWAAQGITAPGALRTAPSAGALYPLEVYVAAGAVRDLQSGIYRYAAEEHSIARLAAGDRRADLSGAALDQQWMEAAAVVLGMAAAYRRTTAKYGERGRRYVHVEAGHAAQNVCLQAVALGLGSAVVGAFDDAAVRRVMRLEHDEDPVCLIVVGRALRHESAGAR